MNEKAEKSDLKNVAIKSLLWKFFEKTGVQVVQLVISVVLARLLMPEDYGVFAMIMVFIAIAQVFIHNGLPYALIAQALYRSARIHISPHPQRNASCHMVSHRKVLSSWRPPSY